MSSEALPNEFEGMKWWIVWVSHEDGKVCVEHIVGYPVEPSEERMDIFGEEIREEFGCDVDTMNRVLLGDEDGRALLKMMNED